MRKQKKVQRKFEYSFISLHANKADSPNKNQKNNKCHQKDITHLNKLVLI